MSVLWCKATGSEVAVQTCWHPAHCSSWTSCHLLVWLQTSLSDEDQYVFTSFLPILQFTSLVIQFEHVYKDVWLLQHCAARSGGNVFCLPPFMSPRRSLVIRLNVISDQVKLNCIKTTFCKSNKRKADFLQVPVYLHTSLQKSHLIGCPKPAFVKKERFIVIKCQNYGLWLICTCPLDVNNNNSNKKGAIVDGSEKGREIPMRVPWGPRREIHLIHGLTTFSQSALLIIHLELSHYHEGSNIGYIKMHKLCMTWRFKTSEKFSFLYLKNTNFPF